MKPGKKFLGTNRGRILAMLREGTQTVGDLARALHITENGVRAHLNGLETEGLVRQSGLLPGTRKPFHAYELTPEGEQLFPKAYGPLLAELLQVLSTKLTEEDLVAACEETGRRLASKLAPGYDKAAFERRVALALETLTAMGGVAAATWAEETVVISGMNCPIGEAVSAEPQACSVAQALLSSITGAVVVEECDKGAQPRCRFAISRP